MKKTARWMCVLALGLALWGPPVAGEDGANAGSFFEALVQQVEAILFGTGGPGDEWGPMVPPGG